MATSPASESLEAAFQVAVASFAAGLTDKQRRQFQGCTLKEVEDTIRGVEARLASQRQQRNMQMVSKFLEGMDQLGKVIEVFVNCDSTVAFIWGPIKFILLTIGTWVETLDCLLDTYVEIGEFLPSLSKYGDLLAKYPRLGIHLHRYYCDILEFHRNALSVFSRPSWKTAFYSAWRNFKTQFGPILSKLKRHRDLLSGEKLSAVITDVHQSVQAVEDKVDTLSRQLQHLYIDDQGLSRRYREDLNQKREFVLRKLDPPDYHYNLEKASNERRDSTSGNWLLADTTFGQWADVTTMELQALFLNGIPGSGKTIVTARVVQHLKQLRAGGQANGSGFILLYFFFNHHQPNKRTFVAMLLSFLSQMLFQDEVLIDLIYQRCVQEDQQKIRSASLLRELVELALQAQRRCFVVVDGLDECDEDQPGKSQAAQGKVIDWLESLRGREADSELNDRRIRLLISGQRNGVLDERLKHWPAIQLDSSRPHMDDIKTYCEAESLQLREEFKGVENLENIRLDIIRRVTSRAKGMFLYAKVVLSNLLDQPTLGDFERELDEENFPQGMDEAYSSELFTVTGTVGLTTSGGSSYERVAVNILENRVEKRFGVARRILNLVICAERPLRWKEIQSHFSIEVQSGAANPKLRLLKPGKQFCGSLIEVSQMDVPSPQGSGPDDVLELVHETARKYLLQTAKFHFHLADLHAEMALFCAQYLCSAPFNPDTSKPDVKMHCMTGYYGFLDYAAAYWWKHGRRAGGCGDNAVLDAVTNLADALSLQHDTTVVQTQIRQLSDDGRDWEQIFPIRSRIEPIRNHLEELLGPSSTEASADLNKLREFYGLLTYKCPNPWCLFFRDGLATALNRDDHVRQHELPFRCDTEGCYRLQIGFARESDLVRHKERLHSEAVSVGFPPTRRGNIFKAATQGQLEVVQDLVAYGASVNAKDKSGSTPLFLAARARNIEVCRWLLEHGAEVDDRCTKEGLTALHAAAANDDVEVVTLLIANHDADIHVRTSTGKSMQTLVEENGCLNVHKAFPPEFWKPELSAPHNPLAFGDFDPERVPNHLKKVREDWSVVFNQAAPRALDVDLLHTLEHESIPCCVKFSHDGKYLATRCIRSAFVYDIASGEKISVLQDENVGLASGHHIRGVCFSPDSKYLATCSEDHLIKVWDIQIHSIKTTFAGHEQDIYSIDFSNDGHTIASGSGDRTARTWDLETGTANLVLTIDDGIISVAISPDTRLLAASSLDNTVRIWDIKRGYLLYHLNGHLDSPYGVAFSPNSCQLLSASLDKDVKMWKLETSAPMMRTNQAPYVKSGHCIKTFKGHLAFALSVTMTPDSEWVLSSSKDCGVHFWDPWTGQMQLRLLGHKNSVISVASSPIATRAGGLFATASGDCRVRIWSYTRLERTES